MTDLDPATLSDILCLFGQGNVIFLYGKDWEFWKVMSLTILLPVLMLHLTFYELQSFKKFKSDFIHHAAIYILMYQNNEELREE